MTRGSTIEYGEIQLGAEGLPGVLAVPERPRGLIAFAHGSGSSRFSPRNRLVAESLQRAGYATLLFDLLREAEAADRGNVFDIPLLAARVHEWVLVVAAMVATTLIYAAYPFMQTALTMGLCSVLLGLALGMVQPMVLSMLHQITPEHRHGEAVGMRMMVINASSVAMPMLFGAAGALVGISAVFWTVAATVGAGIRVALKLKDDRTS